MANKEKDDVTVVILRRMQSFIKKFDDLNSTDTSETLKQDQAFFSYLTKSGASAKFQEEAMDLHLCFVEKLFRVVQAQRAKERKQKQERIQSRFLYVFECLAFITIMAFAWYGMFMFDDWKYVGCMIVALAFFCAFLLFHVKEYERVERIVRQFHSWKHNDFE